MQNLQEPKKTVILEDDRHCFVCGEKNPNGFKLVFELDGKTLRTKFTPEKKHQGFRDIMHGGITMILLDEVLVNLAWRLGINAITAEITARLKKPVRIGETISISGCIEKDSGKILYGRATAKLENGTIVALAAAKLMRV